MIGGPGSLLHAIGPCHVNNSISNLNVHLCEFLAEAGAREAQARVDFIQRAVRCTHDRRAVLRQETVGHPVERVPKVHAVVLVCENIITFSHDETFEWPVTVADLEFAAARIVDIRERAYRDLRHPRSTGRL